MDLEEAVLADEYGSVFRVEGIFKILNGIFDGIFDSIFDKLGDLVSCSEVVETGSPSWATLRGTRPSLVAFKPCFSGDGSLFLLLDGDFDMGCLAQAWGARCNLR